MAWSDAPGVVYTLDIAGGRLSLRSKDNRPGSSVTLECHNICWAFASQIGPKPAKAAMYHISICYIGKQRNWSL